MKMLKNTSKMATYHERNTSQIPTRTLRTEKNKNK